MGLDGTTTVRTLTVLVDVVVTRADWTGFAQNTGTTAPAADSAESSRGSQAWIAGPVIGGVVALVALVGAYLFFVRRRKRSQTQNPDGTWTGKPELHGESRPGAPKPPQEVHAETRSLHELEAEGFVPDQQGGYQQAMAEMAVNEVPAREMDAKTQHQMAVRAQMQTSVEESRQ